MGNTAIMDAGDAVYGSLAECFITIGKRRYNFMNLTEFESKWDVTISDVKILGKVGMGHKAAGGRVPGKARHIIISQCSAQWQTSIRKQETFLILRSR